MLKTKLYRVLFLLLLSNHLYSDSILINLSNDIVNGTDKHLTNSIQLSYMIDINSSHFDNIAFTLTQDIYTPENLDSNDITDYDIPYAGDLESELILYKIYPNYFYSFGISLGTLGEYSYAEDVQTSIHTLTGSTAPKGWSNQVGNKLTYGASFLMAYKTPKAKLIFNTLELNAHAGIKLANHERGFSLGALLRYGNDYPDNFAVIGHPSASQLNLPKIFSNLGWSVSGGFFYDNDDYMYILDSNKELYNIERSQYFLGAIMCVDVYYGHSKLALNLKKVHFELNGSISQERWIGLSYLYAF